MNPMANGQREADSKQSNGMDNGDIIKRKKC